MKINRFLTRALLTFCVAVTAPEPRAALAQESWGPSPTMGSLGSADYQQSLICPTGKHAIGVTVYAATYVNGFELECATLGANGEHQSIGTVSGMVGGSVGGAPKQLRCPSGKVMVGFQGRQGMWIDRVQVACKPWRVSAGGTDGSVTWTSAAGGTGGVAYGPVNCGGKTGVRRIDGWHGHFLLQGELVHSYWFYCRGP